MPIAESIVPEAIPDSEACAALLERILASSQLRRTGRLQKLLSYLGDCALKDDCGQLHEHEIGAAVFGRPDVYDTSVDNIVRVCASALRKRLEAYFNSEGMHETVIMEIPRGGYVPVFRYRAVEPQTITEPAIPSTAPVSEQAEAIPEVLQTSDQRRWMPAALIVAGLIIIGLATCCVALWVQNRAVHRSLYPWKYDPTVADFWSGFLDQNRDTDIITPDMSFGLIQSMTNTPLTLKEYLSKDYLNKLQITNPTMRADVVLADSWSLGNPGQFWLAHRILGLDPLSKNLHLYSARDYEASLIKRDNVILIGNRVGNPWDELFEGRMNFIGKYEYHGNYEVINRAPAAGEQKIYTPGITSGYCVVAYLPNPSNDGKVLLIEGSGSGGTEAGGDFLLSEELLSNFQKMLHVTRFPYFEVLLKSTQMSKTPLTVTIVTYRVYPNLH